MNAQATAPRALAFLGPQRFSPSLAFALDKLALTGTLATVTAGWQERELEIEELQEHIGGRAVNLELHRRAERAFAADPELAQAHRRRQERIRAIEDVYRMRLESAMDVCLALLRRKGDEPLIAEETAAAIEDVRRLDAAHLVRVREAHAEFERAMKPLERDAVRRERDEIARLIEPTQALALAGGHVAVLANRLRLFGVLQLAGSRAIVAWSGGAMVASERIVLFDDHPPFGSGHPQVMDEGLGAIEGLVFLPHAKRRLELDDPARVSLWARRFAPAHCVALDDSAVLTWQPGEGFTTTEACRSFTARGRVEPLVARGHAA